MIHRDPVPRRRFGPFLRGLQTLRNAWRSEANPIVIPPEPQLLVVVEGTHDIEFLRRISVIVHAAEPSLPDLADLERRGKVLFVPFGGGDSLSWTLRLAGLNRREFHLYDRDVPPATEARLRAAALVNGRPGCHAVVTNKRSLENYLDSRAVFEASGLEVAFSDDDHVADLVARAAYAHQVPPMPWDELPARSRKRRRDKVKKWLNTKAVDRMTPERLHPRDPDGEIRSWLERIATLASGDM
ncbi:MAG: ATP-dependent endonuclease [Thermoguttaceae bacterium]